MPAIRLPATTAAVVDVARHVVDVGEELQLGPDRTYRLRLAAEEIATNIVTHGFEEAESPSENPTFELEWGSDPERVWVRFSDDARPFDPTTVPTPSTLDDPLEDRPVGGLGIYLVRISLDEFCYERSGDRNRVTLAVTRAEPEEGRPREETRREGATHAVDDTARR